MSSRLTAREQSLLADIEHHLRREEPALDRRLARAPGPAARLTHRPRLLAAVIAVLSVLTAAGSLWAGAGGPAPAAALLAVGVSALLCGLALLRLAALHAG